MDYVTSSVTHDMVTPLKSVNCLSKQMFNDLSQGKNKNLQKHLMLIHSTIQLILSGVCLHMDRR